MTSAPVSPDGLEPAVAVIIVAAGSGTRLGRREPKAFVPLLGRTLLERAIDGVLALPEPAQVVLVVPVAQAAAARRLADDTAGAAAGYVTVVSGGATRQDSVAAGLSALGAGIETVLVHDAARCLTPVAQLGRVLDEVRGSGVGVIPGLPVSDTIKRRAESGEVLATVDRSELVAVQTPQGFPRAELAAAYDRAARDGIEYTDDAALFAAAGGTVRIVPGDAMAFKITTPWDLHRAEQLVGSDRREAAPRTGIGVDVHAFDPREPLWLAGLHWPGEAGLSGHSDGDAVAHAICDALLSAAGLGDIGGLFGTADPELEGAHGDVFLRRTAELVRAEGFEVANVAVQVLSNRPKVGPRRAEAEAVLSRSVGAPVSVAATTTDGLGFPGEGRGLTAIATALVLRAGVPAAPK
jgi:2-C-methyl-D-erythritol 4-phosphate cytidylyltransferase / 2-C-methyl-D-erythritol 2,4-cyclodiphosphate synthase